MGLFWQENPGTSWIFCQKLSAEKSKNHKKKIQSRSNKRKDFRLVLSTRTIFRENTVENKRKDKILEKLLKITLKVIKIAKTSCAYHHPVTYDF